MLKCVNGGRGGAASGESEWKASARWAFASLALSVLLSSLGASVANVALPTLAHAFAASFQEVQWVVLAYLLAITALVVGAGRLGDIAGRRKLLLAGILLFTGASVLCGVSPRLWMLVAARAAQGMGAALMMAMAMAFAIETAPKGKTGSSIGLLGTLSAAGTALGPSLGGALISHIDWRAVFLVNAPMGLLAFLLAFRHLPADVGRPNEERPSFDRAGMFLLFLSLAAYTLAMTMGRGHFGPLNLALLLAAAFGLRLFALVEARVESPLIRLAMFRDPALRANLAMGVLVSTVMMTTLVVGPFYLSISLGLDTAHVGIAMTVGPVATALASLQAGRLADRLGSRRVAMVGLVAIGVGTFALSRLPTTLGIWGYLAPILAATSGYALFQTANNTAVMAEVDPGQRGVVSGLLNLSRNLGLITGASLMGAVFAAAAGSNLPAARPEDVAAAMRTTFAAASAIILAALGIALGSRGAVERGLLRRGHFKSPLPTPSGGEFHRSAESQVVGCSYSNRAGRRK